MTTPDRSVVRTDRRGRIAVITIDRPAARNAVNGDVANSLHEAFDELEQDADLWVGILTGAGPVFCAGADLKMIAAGRSDAMTSAGFGGLTDRQRTTPVIAAVEGPALAGGFELALACDLIVAGETARFGLPEVKRALFAAAGGLVRLPHRVPRSVALEMALTGDPITAERAHELGLLASVVADGSALDAALALAQRIAANPPVAVRAALAVVETSSRDGEAAGWLRNGEVGPVVTASEDFSEGPRAFIEKRDPVWTGR